MVLKKALCTFLKWSYDESYTGLAFLEEALQAAEVVEQLSCLHLAPLISHWKAAPLKITANDRISSRFLGNDASSKPRACTPRMDSGPSTFEVTSRYNMLQSLGRDAVLQPSQDFEGEAHHAILQQSNSPNTLPLTSAQNSP